MYYIYAKTIQKVTETPFATITDTLISELSLEPKTEECWQKIQLNKIIQIRDNIYSFSFDTPMGRFNISNANFDKITQDTPLNYSSKTENKTKQEAQENQ